MTKKHPPKESLEWEEQVEALAQKMRLDSDPTSTLKNRNYYSLSGYWFPMRVLLKERSGPSAKHRELRADKYVPGQNFNHVLEIYTWDARLREILFRAIAEIEVALRTQVAYHLAQHHPLAHRDQRVFNPRFSEKPALK